MCVCTSLSSCYRGCRAFRGAHAQVESVAVVGIAAMLFHLRVFSLALLLQDSNTMDAAGMCSSFSTARALVNPDGDDPGDAALHHSCKPVIATAKRLNCRRSVLCVQFLFAGLDQELHTCVSRPSEQRLCATAHLWMSRNREHTCIDRYHWALH